MGSRSSAVVPSSRCAPKCLTLCARPTRRALREGEREGEIPLKEGGSSRSRSSSFLPSFPSLCPIQGVSALPLSLTRTHYSFAAAVALLSTQSHTLASSHICSVLKKQAALRQFSAPSLAPLSASLPLCLPHSSHNCCRSVRKAK